MKQFDYENGASLLRKYLGDTPTRVVIYTICESVAKSGMSRKIKAYTFLDNEPACLGWGRVKGGGMDMGFHVAETLFSIAYPNLAYQDYLYHRWL